MIDYKYKNYRTITVTAMIILNLTFIKIYYEFTLDTVKWNLTFLKKLVSIREHVLTIRAQSDQIKKPTKMFTFW